MPDPDLGLDGSRPMDDVHEPAADGRGVVDAAGVARGRIAAVAEQALDVAVTASASSSPATMQDRAARGIDGAVVDRAERRAVRPLTVSAVPPAGRR